MDELPVSKIHLDFRSLGPQLFDPSLILPFPLHITGPYVHVHMRTFYASASCRRVTRCEPTSRQYTAKNHESYYLTRQPETPAIAIHTRGGYLF